VAQSARALRFGALTDPLHMVGFLGHSLLAVGGSGSLTQALLLGRVF
jgi:hypothetical protein